jgi:hypothetical protein
MLPLLTSARHCMQSRRGRAGAWAPGGPERGPARAWSYWPSSRQCWSGRRRQSVGASRSARPGVTSFSLMAQPVRLYLPRGRGAPPQPRPGSARCGLAQLLVDCGISVRRMGHRITSCSPCACPSTGESAQGMGSGSRRRPLNVLAGSGACSEGQAPVAPPRTSLKLYIFISYRVSAS